MQNMAASDTSNQVDTPRAMTEQQRRSKAINPMLPLLDTAPQEANETVARMPPIPIASTRKPKT